MEIIIKSRGGGKTTEIIKKVIKENGYLLTFSQVEADRLERIEPKLRNRVFTWHSLPKCLMGRERRKVFIDNADYFIAEFIENKELGGITLTEDDISQDRKNR